MINNKLQFLQTVLSMNIPFLQLFLYNRLYQSCYIFVNQSAAIKIDSI